MTIAKSSSTKKVKHASEKKEASKSPIPPKPLSIKKVEKKEEQLVSQSPCNNKNWDYENVNEWGSMYPAANGLAQSPIDLINKDALHMEKLHKKPISLHYQKDFFRLLKNTGSSFNVEPNAQQTSNCAELKPSFKAPFLRSKYSFLQFHMHWGHHDHIGSEHLVDGKSYAGELHFVHWNFVDYATPAEAMQSDKHDGLVVLGVFVKVSEKSNREIAKIVEKLVHIKAKDQTTTLNEDLHIEAFFPKSLDKYYTYLGSLTTPPCYESVQWVVFKDPIELTATQISSFKKLGRCECEHKSKKAENQLVTNFRNVCDLNGRRVIKSFPH